MSLFNSLRTITKKNRNHRRHTKQLNIEGLENRRLMCSEGALCPSGSTELADVSLRDLVIQANEHSNHDVIELQAYTTYHLGKRCSGGEYSDRDDCGDLDIREDLTIRASGPGATIDARPGPNATAVDRVMEVFSTLTLDGVTVTGGVARNGGGIFNDGTVNLNNGSSVNDNTAALGGGIFNDGTVNLNNGSSVNGNAAESLGGGFFNDGTVNLVGGSSVNGNTADGGGGIFNFAVVNLDGGSSVNDNTSDTKGGGIYNYWGNGSIPYSTVNLNGGSSVNDNSAVNGHGGGIYNYGGAIKLNGGSSVNDNSAMNGHGGGIYSASDEFEHLVTHYAEINNNRAPGNSSSPGRGGGVFVTGLGSAKFEHTAIAGNESETFGAGIFVDQGSVHVIASTISDNTSGHNGGGIYNYYGGTVNLVNSTISGNHATGSNRLGGGVANAGRLYATNSTITNNRTGYKAGGVYNFSSAKSAELYNTIVAGNVGNVTADDYWPASSNTGSNNLFGTYRGSVSSGNLQAADAMLGPLTDNGGFTKTHAPLSGSPAINAGGDFLSGDYDQDQRGKARHNGQIDIGSVEYGSVYTPVALVWEVPVVELDPQPVGWSYKYDFGTSQSPVESGYMQATGSTLYSSGKGFGWTSQQLNGYRRESNDALTSDYVHTNDGTFRVDLPDGTYNVAATFGDFAKWRDEQSMYVNGILAGTVDTDAGQFRQITTTVMVTNGTLDVRIIDGGARQYAMITDLEISTAS